MNKFESSIKRECDIYMNHHDLENSCTLSVVYYKEDNILATFAYVVDETNPDELWMIKPYFDDEPKCIAEWAYNIDEYDFEHLAQGYKIAYMSMDTHYGFWCTLEDWLPDDISNVEGFQKYLDYCKTNGICKEVIENAVGLELREDIMKYHIGKNQHYTQEVSMSILTEYEEIRKELSPKEISNINHFLEAHPKYLLSDVYYNKDVYIEFETWQAKQDLNKIKYYYKGMNRDPFIQLSFEDLMQALQDYPKLKEFVLSYAENSIKENSLLDKRHTISAIKKMDTEILYNHDTEVRECFCESFNGGLKSYMKDLRECIASNKQNLKKNNQER